MPYGCSLRAANIKFSDLVDLAQKGEVPCTLFFTPIAIVHEIIGRNTTKPITGISRHTF